MPSLHGSRVALRASPPFLPVHAVARASRVVCFRSDGCAVHPRMPENLLRGELCCLGS